MNPIKKFPIIISSKNELSIQFDGDCACSIPTAKTCLQLTDDSAWHVAPQLYRTALSDEYELFFNQSEGKGVSVLNTPAIQILDSLQTAQPLDHLTNRETIQEFLSSGLLTHCDQATKKKDFLSDTLAVWLQVTNNCNLSCDYCYIKKTPENMGPVVGKTAIDSIFRSAAIHSFKKVKIKYSGGEATLNFPLVIELHKYATKLANQTDIDLDGIILTNGVYLSKQMIADLKSLNLRVSLSLDGIGTTNDKQRKFKDGRGSFSFVERTLNRLREANVIPSITITVTSRNAIGLPETVSYLLNRNLPFSINFYRTNKCSIIFDDLKYENEYIVHYMEKAFDAIEQNLPAYSLLGVLLDRTRLDILHDHPCSVGDSYLVINHQGDIAKCHMQMEKSITNIYVQDALSFIQSDTTGIINDTVDNKDDCQTCQWRYWCAGGCPALTYHETGDYRKKSPNCSIYQALFPRLLKLEGLRLLKYGQQKYLVLD